MNTEELINQEAEKYDGMENGISCFKDGCRFMPIMRAMRRWRG